MSKKDFDAVVVGSGPNGLAAAIELQQNGLQVCILEAKAEIGGGLRTEALTLPGFQHDVCAAIHPLCAASPYLEKLPLHLHGLEYIFPETAAAHPFDDGKAGVLYRSLEKTAKNLGIDEQHYLDIFKPLTKNWPLIAADVLAPLHIPSEPFKMAAFGLKAMTSALYFAKNNFKSREARGLWAGMAAHSIQPLKNLSTSAIALVLMIAGHSKGWPIPKGGAKQIAGALEAYFVSLGGTIQTNFEVSNLAQLPSSEVVLFDITPKQLLKIAGHKFSNIYKWQLEKYQYGMGVYKMDWALDGPIPFTNTSCNEAATIHLGGTLEEVASNEQYTAAGGHPDKPFVLLAQQSVFDPGRAPAGKHTAWAYCHVPNGSTVSMEKAIEAQIERFAPGFRERILAKSIMDTRAMESHNANYIGGDINAGILNLKQLFTRPALRYSPYKTSAKGLYICSASTPPGPGVHGMCGYHAAQQVFKDFPHLKNKAIGG
jgi:phytoene dehydrogenase-like protein